MFLMSGLNQRKIKVVILCGGLGTRLREETEFMPKPMVKIGNRPILWHIMKIYTCYGLSDFILCLGYKGDMIKEYFHNYELLSSDFTIEFGKSKKVEFHNCCSEIGWRITLADTGEKTLKGARLKRIEKHIHGDHFMVTYGDGVANIDINALLNFHLSHGKIATVTGICPTTRFGELKVRGNKVESFREKPVNESGFVSGGFFVFKKKIFDYLSDDDMCDFETGALEKLANEGNLMIYKHKGFWSCMDTIRDVEYLNKLWTENKAGWKIW